MIVLPILFETETTETNNIIGKNNKVEDYEVRDVVFLHINYIEPIMIDNKEVSIINTNGECMYCPLSINELKNYFK